MTSVSESGKRVRSRLRVALAVIAVLVLALVVPPLISVSHYKARITQIISRSLGRPVRLSSVQVRLLPWPGFELSDLSVAEDPAYGAEPVLHASTVIASVRLLALFGGHIEIGKISVDDASLNVVRAGPGRWNLDPLFRTAAAQTESVQGARHANPLPYLEATNSRIDFKNGAEKLPFSLIDADVSFWQENPGEWRIRLRGQPARTDVSLFQEETGIVRLEASVRRAPALRQMPLHLDLDWREAQLGQLARLVSGADPGWRGDLTGELHLDGTADAAQVTMRLRAEGVHRAEFTPASPLDFDANCGFVYHYAQRSLEKLTCDSPLGDGRIHITGEKPGEDAPPHFTVALDRIPVAAGLDALRTFRSSIAPDLEASGTVSGKLAYAQAPAAAPQESHAGTNGRTAAGKAANREARVVAGPLSGSLTVADFSLSGGGLTRPIEAAKMTLEPVGTSSAPHALPGVVMAQALAGTAAIAAGGAAPLTLNVHLSINGYRVGLHGQASLARAREMANAAGIPETPMLAELSGDPIAVDLTAAGPWIPPEEIPVANVPANGAGNEGSRAPQTQTSMNGQGSGSAGGNVTTDTLTGTVALHNVNWKPEFLASKVVIEEATLHLDNEDLDWDPVAFTYGPLKGTASLTVPVQCPSQTPPQPCPTEFQMHFGDLDAAAVQTALLGARTKSTLLSDLINRIHPSTAPPWPRLEGTADAESLALGPVTLKNASAAMRITATGAEITSLDANVLGGSVHATGTLTKPETDADKPAYALEGDFTKLNATDLGGLLGFHWTGAAISGNGRVELAGYSGKDLASSAKGSLQFEALRGAITAPRATVIPVALNRFDSWSGDAEIANGAVAVKQSQMTEGARKRAVEAMITFGDPPRISFGGAAKEAAAKRK